MNKKIKIVFLHPPLYPINHKIFNKLSKYIDLLVISFGKEPELNKWNINNEKFNYKLIFIDGYTDPKKHAVSYKTQFTFKWIQFLKKFNPDIVVSIAFWIPSLYAGLLKNFFNYKFLILTDAVYYTDKNISLPKKFLRKFMCKKSDGIISSSKLTTEYMNFLCPKTKIYESPHIIDVKEWQKNLNRLANKQELRIKLNIPSNKNILLGVGNFIEKKNWESVFYNIKNLDIYFILIGGGKLKNKYLKIVEELNIENKVKILDRKMGKELYQYFKLADIFIFPSIYDQFGLVVLEALASGLPVLCSNKSGASSIIKDDFNGYRINPNESYDTYIEKTIENLERMKKNALISSENYSIEKKIKNFIEIFDTILEKNVKETKKIINDK